MISTEVSHIEEHKWASQLITMFHPYLMVRSEEFLARASARRIPVLSDNPVLQRLRDSKLVLVLSPSNRLANC